MAVPNEIFPFLIYKPQQQQRGQSEELSALQSLCLQSQQLTDALKQMTQHPGAESLPRLHQEHFQELLGELQAQLNSCLEQSQSLKQLLRFDNPQSPTTETLRAKDQSSNFVIKIKHRSESSAKDPFQTMTPDF